VFSPDQLFEQIADLVLVAMRLELAEQRQREVGQAGGQARRAQGLIAIGDEARLGLGKCGLERATVH
jgi:hypothetical protein